eukprot:TRINITY_DN2160_c0_g1_i3.p1 TRINITY_DN2160_c0_g1~~TRINITY_DN2160_c0_g1_i3.p1  ORF type:complete len:383 (+),score=64.90 TRINITY_DN2160_c0_g1_i3:107-1255(+)
MVFWWFFPEENFSSMNNTPNLYLVNKRLDEWVSDERLSVQLPEDKDQENNAGTADGKNEKEPIRKMTRNMKRKYDEENHVPKSFEDMDATTAILEKMHEENTKMKNINQIVLGKYVIDAWYCSPYPEEYANQALLFICEFCLKYMKLRSTYEKHKASCKHKHPPGDEIYRDGVISAYEVFGSKQKLYCQNLCLLSKLFLDHKTLYYDVDHFIFYILTEHDDDGTHLVGYFSKEKYSAEDYNLACIMILPCHQRKGYGKFLISLSYELSKREGKVGSPEKPLSDLGQLSYRSYWTQVLLDILYHYRGTLTIKEMSQITAMKIEDIVSTLQSLNLIRYWKGQHIISMTPKIVEEHLRESAKQQLRLDASKLFWLPYEFKPVKRK